MKLLDLETNKEYEFDDQLFKAVEFMAKITLKQVEKEKEWPQKGSEYWLVADDHEALESIWCDDQEDRDARNFMGIYRTKQEAEYAAERIRSLQEVDEVGIGKSNSHDVITLYLKQGQEKYLKAWQALESKDE